jgi:uncharacterized cupredoxin-like copper-binding protein
MENGTTLFVALGFAACIATLPPAALANSDAGHASAPRPLSTELHPWGVEGDPKRATRVIEIAMSDDMRYSHREIRVARGETVTFVIRNRGRLLHEFVIGTPEELQRHTELMRKHPGMEHDEPYMAHVKPGAERRLTWRFTNAGTFEYACLVAGHYEAGMKGAIIVIARD